MKKNRRLRTASLERGTQTVGVRRRYLQYTYIQASPSLHHVHSPHFFDCSIYLYTGIIKHL